MKRLGICLAMFAMFGCEEEAPAPAANPPASSTQPSTTNNDGLSMGQIVEAQDSVGSWLLAKVTEVRADGQYRVHFLGYSDGFDENVPMAKIRVLPPQPGGTSYTVNQQVAARDKMGSWLNATILEARPDGTYRVHFDDYSEAFDEDVYWNEVRQR